MKKAAEIEIENNRILIVDDTKSIHEDFRKVLLSSASADELDELEAALFGEETTSEPDSPTLQDVSFELESAFQGQEAYEMVKNSIASAKPYALAFVDIRMPPGWDGVETIKHLWEVDPNLQVAVCTAYSDYSWDEMRAQLGNSDRLLILKKPFENIEVLQTANAMVSKWNLTAKANLHMDQLSELVARKTQKVEEQKEKLQRQLEELQQTRLQLVQSEKLASIGQLAAGIAHEINNPVGYIASNIDSLKDYFEDLRNLCIEQSKLVNAITEGSQADFAAQAAELKSQQEQLDVNFMMDDIDSLLVDAIEGTTRVKGIVADLSDFSHVNSPDVVSADINALLEKTVSVACNEIKYKAEVKKEFGEIPEIKCYGGKLSQVFLNLVVNASHAIDEAGVITLKTGHENDTVWIEVNDNGSGISEENLAKIFDPFFTTKEVGKGTGLGLHIVASIIESHQGQITVTSELGIGTTFRIELPINPQFENEQVQAA